MASDSISMNMDAGIPRPGLDRALAFRSSRLPGDLQSGAAYTAELADIEKVIRFTGTGAAVLTIAPDATVDFPIGSVITAARDGTGGVTIAAGGNEGHPCR